MAIDIGSAAVNRAGATTTDKTHLTKDNPADGDGAITSVEIWAQSNTTGSKVGTFSGSGTSYTNRDVESIGAVTSGSKQTFSGLDIDVVTGDFIGHYCSAGNIEYEEGAHDVYRKDGDQFGAGAQTYTLYTPRDISLYGTGIAIYDETSRSQAILAAIAKGEQLTIGETTREQILLAVQAAADLHTINETAKSQTVLAALAKSEQLTMVETYRSRPDQRYHVPLTIDHDLVGITQVLASNAASGQKDVVVQKGSAYGVGDSVVIKDSGNRETGTVASVAGDTVTLEGNLTNAYTTANGAWLKNVTDSTDVTDFPAYFNEHDLPSTFWTKVKSDGSDIVVYSPTGVKLKRELVAGSWDRAGHTMELHVRVPSASTTVDTIVQLWYGYAAGAETNDTDTWDVNYKGVSHMNDNPDTSSIKDSTDNGNDGTKTGANNPNQVAGDVGYAQDFDGDDVVTIANHASLNPTDVITVEVKFKTTDTKAALITKDNIINRQWAILIYGSYAGHISGYVFNSTGSFAQPQGSGEVDDGNSHIATLVYDGANVSLYIDGVLTEAKNLTGNIKVTTEPVLLGQLGVAGWALVGIEDEARISDIARTPNHISTTNNTLMRPTFFYSVGAEVDHEMVILATVGETDLATFNETGKSQAILVVASATDLATFLETAKTQTILTVVGESDLATFLETDKEQVVLAALSGNAYKKYIETLREQVVLGVIGKGEQLVIGETARSQVVLAALSQADKCTFNEAALEQVILAALAKSEQLTMVETYRSRPDQRYHVPLTIDHDLVGITQILTSNAASGQKDVVVQKGSAYGVGDSVVIKDSGNREAGTVASVAGDTVTLEGNLTNAYTTANGAWLKNVTDSTDVTDFPAYFSEHDLPSTFWTKVKADGTDIVVYSPTGVKLKRELVAGSWDRAGHTMELHVRVPSASTTVDTIVQLWYGYAAGAETNDTEVWERSTPAILTNNTGIATGSPISRYLTAALTVEITQAGTFDVVVPTGGTVYVKSDTATVTDSPVTLTSNGQITVSDTGNISFQVGGYVFVSHMNDDPDNEHIKDSTANGNDGTKSGAGQPTEAAGLVGRCQDFDSVNSEYIASGNAGITGANRTFEVLMYNEGNTHYEGILMESLNIAGIPLSADYVGLQVDYGLNNGIALSNGDGTGCDYLETDPATLDSAWRYIAGVITGASKGEIFKDGASWVVDNTWTHTPYDTDVPIYFGRIATQYLDAKICEARISDIARTPNHISTTNNTLKRPTFFYSVGAEVDHEMVILATVGETDLATIKETGKEQTILAIIEKSDIATFLETSKAQTILAVTSATDLATFLETSKEQVVLVVQDESDAYVMVETNRTQTILTVISEADEFFKFLTALKYVLELHNSDGDLLAILENAHDIGYAQMINSPHSLSFSIPADDSKTSNITLANEVWLRNCKTGEIVKKFRLSTERDTRN